MRALLAHTLCDDARVSPPGKSANWKFTDMKFWKEKDSRT